MNWRDSCWITKNKEYIPIKEMKTSHIKNCLLMLIRVNNEDIIWRKNFIKLFKKELKYRRLNKLNNII